VIEENGTILSARDYTFTIAGKKLLGGISFQIAAGARCAVIGPNGAGKSTLLKSFCRILPPGRGELRVGGRLVQDYRHKELAQWLSYVPQTGDRENHFEVREFVLLGRYPQLSPFSTISRADWQEVERVLAMTGMSGFAERRMHTLSGGEYQKVLIAAALAQGSRVLLLDEPAAFLDPCQRCQVYELLEDLHETAGLTLVEVTHDLNRAALWHDQVIGLSQGRVVFDGSAKDLMRDEPLSRIYGKRFLLAPHPQSGRIMALPEVHG